MYVCMYVCMYVLKKFLCGCKCSNYIHTFMHIYYERRKTLKPGKCLRLGRNGLEEVKSHPWFNGLDFGNLRGMRAPHLPKGSSKIKGYLKELQVSIDMYVCMYSIVCMSEN